MRIRFGTVVLALVVAQLAIVAWIFFAPTNLGGSSTYAVTSGISMQPLLYKNDLAIVRAQSTYRVGEVVLYHSAVLGEPVLHRIILIQNGQYYFKGDNNDFVDPGYATRSELVGALWVHVPEVGAAIIWLGRPRERPRCFSCSRAPRRAVVGAGDTAWRHSRRRARREPAFKPPPRPDSRSGAGRRRHRRTAIGGAHRRTPGSRGSALVRPAIAGQALT